MDLFSHFHECHSEFMSTNGGETEKINNRKKGYCHKEGTRREKNLRPFIYKKKSHQTYIYLIHMTENQ